MEKIKRELKSLPRYFWIIAAITGVTQFATYYLPRLIVKDGYKLLSSAADDKIPVIPGFIYIYVLAYAFWVINYIIFYRMSKQMAYRLFTADLICKAVCLGFFIFYPCTMNQPDVNELSGFGVWLMKIIYASDEPTQLLPSMHCHLSVLLALPFFSKYDLDTKLWYKLFSVLFAILVCASTVLVKQHVLADVYTGMALALLGWLISLLIWKKIDDKTIRKGV